MSNITSVYTYTVMCKQEVGQDTGGDRVHACGSRGSWYGAATIRSGKMNVSVAAGYLLRGRVRFGG